MGGRGGWGLVVWRVGCGRGRGGRVRCGLWWSGGAWQWAARRGSLSVLACMRAQAEGGAGGGVDWSTVNLRGRTALAVAKDEDTRAALQVGRRACACARGWGCGCGSGCGCGYGCGCGCRCGCGCGCTYSCTGE